MAATGPAKAHEIRRALAGGDCSRRDIAAVAEERGIRCLLHFTRLCNVPGILEHGIYPRSRLGELPHPVAINDDYRYDRRPESVSLSLGHPNYRMFFKYRQSTRDDWAVLAVHPSVMWESPCAFCKHNAADLRISSLPLDALTGPATLRAMFDEHVGSAWRSVQNLQPFHPTDPQAEVLVFGVISPAKILGAVFRQELTCHHFGREYPGVTFVHHREGTGVFGVR